MNSKAGGGCVQCAAPRAAGAVRATALRVATLPRTPPNATAFARVGLHIHTLLRPVLPLGGSPL
jgi:hypothetical protein